MGVEKEASGLQALWEVPVEYVCVCSYREL